MQQYVQRCLDHLLSGGEIVLLDRCWFTGAGVERVMGSTNRTQVDEFLSGAPNLSA